MSIENVLKKYKSTSIQKANELLFNHQDANKILGDCGKAGITIVGMDFWIKKGRNIIQVNSTSYESISSGVDAPAKTIKSAKKLIEEKLPDNATYVSFILK